MMEDGKRAMKKLMRLIQENHVEKLGDPFMNKVHKWLVKPWSP
jgi:RNase P/RNase MRP subunit POP5